MVTVIVILYILIFKIRFLILTIRVLFRVLHNKNIVIDVIVIMIRRVTVKKEEDNLSLSM